MFKRVEYSKGQLKTFEKRENVLFRKVYVPTIPRWPSGQISDDVGKAV